MTIYFFKFPLRPSLGGGDFYILKLALHLKSQGRSIKLVTSDRPLLRLFEKHGLPHRRLFAGWEPTSKWSLMLWPLTWLIARRKLKKIMRFAPRNSIFFCQSLTEKLVLPPLVRPDFSLRAIFLEHKIPGRWLRLSPLRFWYLRLAKISKVITVSEFAKQAFINFGVPEKNISVIYPGVHKPALLRDASRIFKIGVLGRLDPEKGAFEFLNSLLSAFQSHPGWQVLLAGEGQETDKIKNFIKTRGLESQVQLCGFIKNVDDFFSRISVLAYPTRVPESFGMAAAEALAQGIPVVASRIGALPEIIKHGENGFLVSWPAEGETRPWINFFESLQNPKFYQKLSSAALEISQTFSETKMFRAFDELLKV